MIEQRSPEWFAQQRGRLTASLAGAALGLSPNMSKEAAFRALGRSMHGLDDEFEGNVATEWGSANEDLAKAAYELETGNTVAPAEFVPYSDWSGASPDGYVGPNGLVEFKCPFGLREDENPEFKPIEDQLHYYARVQLQMFFCGKNWCDFFQWTPYGMKIERVNPDPDWIAQSLAVLKKFWDDAKAAPKAEFKEPMRKLIDTPEAVRLVREYDELSEAIDNAKTRQEDIIARMVEVSKGKNAKIAGRNFTLAKRKGSVSYAEAIKELVPDADLEKWRGKPSESWQLK